MWLERKYVELVASQLHRFKDKGNGLYNFCCPLCNEYNESKKRGARGYLYEKAGALRFACHRCGEGRRFSDFLREIDPTLGREYTLEFLRENGEPRRAAKVPQKPPEKRAEPAAQPNLKVVAKLSMLPPAHPARAYMAGRGFSDAQLRGLLYVPRFKKWVNSLVKGKFDNEALEQDEDRIVIPFKSVGGELTAFQGRSLRKDAKVKYITIVLDEEEPALYGLDKVDWSQDVFVHEGPLDAMMFGQNSIATAGGDLAAKLRGFDKDKLIVVYDNEPRSPTTIKKIRHAVDLGFRIGLWSSSIKAKDVNAMVLAGHTPEALRGKISIFKDLSARLALSDWSKVNDKGRISRPHGVR